MISLGLGLWSTTILSRLGFSPSALFANGEVGVWYDPSPETTFTDTAGTTPATVGDAVALMLDKSKGLVLGPELVTNGTFDSDLTGWSLTAFGGATASVVSGQAQVVTTSSDARAGIQQSFATVIGTRYTLQLNYAALSTVPGNVRIHTGSALSPTATFAPAAGSTISASFVAANTTTFVLLGPSGIGTALYDNISIRELPGYHAVQPTAAARPILARVPASGRRNLLTRTEEFDDGVWVKGGGSGSLAPSVTRNAAVAPNGENTATLISYTAVTGGGFSVLNQLVGTGLPSATLIGTGWVKAATAGDVGRTVYIYNSGQSNQKAHVLTADWQRIDTTAATPNSAYQLIFGSLGSGVGGADQPAFGMHLWGAQLELGSTATAYQRAGSTYDVTEAGQADNYHLVFDGVDDSMVTPSIDFTGTDEMSVFAGVRKLSDAASVAVEISVDQTANAGAFVLVTGEATGPGGTLAGYIYRSRGNAASGSIQAGQAATFTAPDTAVISGLSDISADTSQIRRNGVAGTTGTADQGTGNYGNYPMFIGARSGTSNPFNGHLYSLLVRGALTADNLLNQTETYVASKTAGVDLT
jgi:hypothetical protein